MAITNKWLLIILVLLPVYLVRFNLFGIPLNLLDLLVTGGFIYYIIHYGFKVQKIFLYSSVSLLLIGLISVIMSDNTLAALGIYKSYIVIPIMVGVMIQVSKPKFIFILQALGSSVLFVSTITIIQFLTGYGVPAPWNIGGIDVRMTSIFEYPNAVGLFCAPIVALGVAWLIHERSHKLWFMLVSLMGMIAIGLSQSDGAVITVILAGSFALLFTKYRYGVIGVGLILVMISLIIPVTREKILLQDTSGQVRLALWQGTVNLLEHRPLFGAGLANFPDVYAQYKLDQHVELLLYPHNLFLDFWVELGLLGMVWLIIVLIVFFLQAKQSQQTKYSIILLTGMVAFIVYGLVDVPYFKNDLAIIFWTMLALNFSYHKKQINS
ncbi:MAG: O-antigen ligase family protein [Patescibacteria group bacterium]